MKKFRDIKPINLDNKNSSGFVQKIKNFVQYNNAFVLIVVFVLGVSGVALGSENIREGVLLGKVEKEIGVDNAILLSLDINNWDFLPQILDIEEDEEYYYVSYKFKTLGVKDNIWQEIWRENILKFEKNSDRYSDVSEYISKEIGEVIQREFQLLKDSQKAAREGGRTQRTKVVAYNGLVGKILNLETKVIPQENPLIISGEVQIAQNPLPSGGNQSGVCLDCAAQNPIANNQTIDKELIRKIVEEILAQKQQTTGGAQEDNPAEEQEDNNPTEAQEAGEPVYEVKEENQQ